MGKLKALDPTLCSIEELQDAFYRENQFVERFYELITTSIQPPFAISVDGLWGSGKTTLMKLLQRRLKDEYSTFWFNPWEYQDAESIVLAFLQALSADAETKFGQAVKEGLKIVSVVGLLGMNIAINALLKPIVDLKMGDVKSVGEEYENARKKEYEKYKDLIKIIQDDFRCLVKNIRNQKERKEDKEKPIIIFFDDLDRCLPDKAIQLLEAVKNLFVVKDCQVIFICGIDTRVAKQFIKSHYKDLQENFAINYFRKIFNLTISMPYTKNVYTMLLEYIKKLYEWDDAQSDALAKMIYTRGLQAEISSARTYLNIVHNFYAFRQFNAEKPNFSADREAAIHLLVVKEAWQSLYEELVREALKNRLETMGELVGRLLAADAQKPEDKLESEQRAFLEHYFVDSRSAFSRLVLADLLFEYPTLA